MSDFEVSFMHSRMLFVAYMNNDYVTIIKIKYFVKKYIVRKFRIRRTCPLDKAY